ncbi:MAG TPA: YicC/YloC family endoribonuclease [Candidatus Saccharimonadia bacterium]|nr:YicC/YloC family endoribonuclease [Candidatus Saccharimonadia bacterium]
MHSMTGFGRGEAIADGIVWRAEASSVNRKQLELVVGLPRELSELEIPLRNRCASRLSRGRVQVSISMDQGAASASKLRVDEALAQQYADALQHLAQKLHISPTLSLTEMTRWPGVFSIEQTSWTPELALPHLEKAVDAALTQMLAMRHAEGLNLKTDISTRLDALQVMLREARALSPQIIERQRDMLRQRLADAGLPLPLDDERLVKEIALFADRSDTTEEQTRAESHIAQFRTYMDSGEPVGRSLDFLSQELFREFNTMGSKANHAQLAQLVVRAKTELEKIREQVQNVE